MSHWFFYRWLWVASIGVILFGVGFLILPDFMYTFFNTWYLGTPNPPEFTEFVKRYVQFTYGVLGAVMVGWGVALLAILRGSFQRGERAGWLAIAGSLVIWFVPDTLHSLAFGFPSNAVLNLGMALLFAIPLAATYRHFFSPTIPQASR